MLRRFSRLLLVLMCCGGSLLFAQQGPGVHLIKGTRFLEANVADFSFAEDVAAEEVFQGRYYRLIQFDHVPTLEEQRAIAAADLKLISYLPRYAYVASLSKQLTAQRLQRLGVRSIVPLDPAFKLGIRLETGDYPDWAVAGTQVKVTVEYAPDVSPEAAVRVFQRKGFEVGIRLDHAQLVELRLRPGQVSDLVALPFVLHADVVGDPGTPESDDGRHLHRANAIDGDHYGARNYDGTGVAFAINDDGFAGPHIDFQGRTNQQDVAGDFAGSHGDMVAGIAGGAGNLDPSIRGMATGSYLHIRQYRPSLSGTVPLHRDSAVLIFSSSYSNGCNAGYTNTTALVDREIFEYPHLMQTFSAGNSNNQNCGYGAGNQWGNITGGHKMGKNVIATANLSANDNIANSSSRGPASDGRIKPDLAAHGANQMSTDPNNGYSPGGGTSAAAPGVCGVMAQLYHAYREINGGAIAHSALLKAALMVTANDLGNDGPDFVYGWGKINGLRAVQLLEDGRHLLDTLAQGSTNTHTFSIPANVRRAKIMVYWADREASTSAATALVNDLDATVTDPSAGTHLPWLLNSAPNPATLALPAGRGADHLNNVEEIAIDNPSAGNYTLNVVGTTVPMGTQAYYVVYEFLTDEVTVIHPLGGEGIEPNTDTRIHWDAYGSGGSFRIEYTDDDGATWNTISNSVPGSRRFLTWRTPNTLTGQARVRVSRSGATDESDANFSIMRRPENLRVVRVCTEVNELQVAWDPVAGATAYDVFLLGEKFMDSVGTTANLTFNVSVGDLNEEQWFSVRAVGPNGLRSERQIAEQFAGIAGLGGGCLLSCAGDNDVGVAEVNSLSRILYACPGSMTVPVRFTLENLGLFPESNFDVSYQVNNDPAVTETYANSLPAGGNVLYNFAQQITFPSSGDYTVKVWTNLGNDSTDCNDTITRTVTVLAGNVDAVTTDTACVLTSGTLSAEKAEGILEWYNDVGTLVHIGDTFTTPVLTSTTTYRVRNVVEAPVLDVGPLDGTQVGTGGYHGGNFYGVINFTAFRPFDLLSVWIDAESAGPRTITLWRGNIANGGSAPSNVVVQRVTVNVPRSGPQRINLNFEVPVAGDYAIGGNNMDLFRNRTGADYPYILDDIVSLTSSSAGSTFDFYYYFYDWEVQPAACISPQVTVIAEVVEADFGVATLGATATFSDSSVGATSWRWDFGDGTTSTQQNPTHTYTTAGPHIVTLAINGGDCAFSDSVTVEIAPDNIGELVEGLSVTLVPNPATQQTQLRFSQALPADIDVAVFNAAGKQVYAATARIGTDALTLDVAELPAALYLVRLRSGEVLETHKLLVRD